MKVLYVPYPALGRTGPHPVRPAHQNMLGYLEGQHPNVHASIN